MRTKVIKGVAPLANDEEILAAIQGEAKPQLGGKVMVVGIRNDAGIIYRSIHTAGLTEFLGVVEVLGDLELVDELEFETEMREGCDAIFRPFDEAKDLPGVVNQKA